MSVLDNPIEVQNQIDLGLCLVPSNIQNKDNKPKTPWYKWKQITERLTGIELLDLMWKHKADSVAVVYGIISGGDEKGVGLFIIDIDTKYKLGIDSKIFSDLKEFYPEIFKKLKIEKTPSGGYHIYYRIKIEEGYEFPTTSGVLAGRSATEDELEKKPSTSMYGFIEAKHICQCYPSTGYSLVKGKETLNILNWSEHSSVLNLMKEYDERIEKQKGLYIKPLKNDSSYYDESPWISYNGGSERDSVLNLYGGWRRKNGVAKGGRIYFIKPGKPSNYREDGAVYREDKNAYIIYTTSGGIDDGMYSPVNLLLKLKFGGDKSLCWAWLVSEGYGKLKESREKSIIKKTIGLGKGEDFLPKNISLKAREEFKEEISKIGSDYCYGVFWEMIKFGGDNEKERWEINRENLYYISGKLGFVLAEEGLCYISNYIIEVVDERFYFDVLKKYIGNCDIEIRNCYEYFIEKHGKFTITRLEKLDKNILLESTKEISYKPYNNGYVRITKEGIILLDYKNIDGKLIWKHLIQERDYIECSKEEAQKGLYWKFLEKAIQSGVNDYLLKIIGYYAHDYKSTRTPYIAVLCEICDNPDNGGGSGKNVFTNLFRLTSSVLNKPAKGIKFDDTMLRTRKQERIISINDAEKDFDYSALREFSSGEGEVGKKYEKERTISNKDMPKPMVNTGYAFNPYAQGLRRRLIPIEFTNFFIDCGGVDVYFKIDFPSEHNDNDHGWNEKDYISYDYVILEGIRLFLEGGCKLYPSSLTEGGWVKQFEQEFFQSTFNFINQYIGLWLGLEKVKINEVFNKNYSDFCFENNIQAKWQLSSIKMNKALVRYCEHNGIYFEPYKNLGKDLSGKQENGKVFKKIEGFKKVAEEVVTEDFESIDELPF